jgi:S1-C subfamily serine protease
MQDYSGYGGYGGDFGSTAPMPPMPPQPPPRRRIGLLSYLAVALAAGALGAGTVVAVYHPAASSSASAQPSGGALPPAPLPSTAVPTPSGGGSGTGGGTLSQVQQGLVIINTTLQYSSEQAAGTGMVINAGNGLVLTNNHVIENATNITATVASTGKTFPAKVVGYDVTGDIALIQLQNPSGLHAVPLGDSGTVKTGASVVALGNADGRSQIVSASGQVTAINQTITASDQGGTVRSETLHGMIQTNADIVAGDSGGPLVNTSGRVIGMDTAGNSVSFTQQQTVAGFAIPINTALSVAREIVAGHASSTIVVGYPPFIGIYVGQGTDSNPQDQASQEQQQNNGFGGNGFGNGNGNGFGNGFGNGNGNGNGNGSGSGGQACYTSNANLTVPSTIAPVNSGTLVIGTICNSPATAAGLTAGSVITGVDGQTVGSPQSLGSIMAKLHPGDTVPVSWVTPSGQRQTASLALTAGPPL